MTAKLCITESLCKSCEYCIQACPKKILELASHFNENGFHPVQITDEEKCTGCGFCYQICPEIAIEVSRGS